MGDFSNVLAIAKNITLINIIDIAIVGYILYKIYMLIKESRAEQLIKGLILIVVVMKLSEILNLVTLHFLIQNTLTVGLIAVIVIFQPELRRALEHLGRSKFLTRRLFDTDEEMGRVIDEIAMAAVNLSDTKTGGLIIIEQDTGLKDYVASGIKIDAAVSISGRTSDSTRFRWLVASATKGASIRSSRCASSSSRCAGTSSSTVSET
jgi:diadenylate cyclase